MQRENNSRPKQISAQALNFLSRMKWDGFPWGSTYWSKVFLSCEVNKASRGGTIILFLEEKPSFEVPVGTGSLMEHYWNSEVFVLTQKLEKCQTDQLSYRTRPSCYRNSRLWLKLCDRGVSPVSRNLPTEKLGWDTEGMWQKSLRWNVSALSSSYVECHRHPSVSW